jgi:ketosteroid isomerase-like protein
LFEQRGSPGGRGDIDEAVSFLHPEAEWIEPEEFPDGGRRIGPAAVADYLRRSRSRWDVLRSEPDAYRHGDHIVVFHHVHGRLADGTSHPDTVADVYTLRDGKVVRMQAYADPAQALTWCPWRSSTACQAWCWS